MQISDTFKDNLVSIYLSVSSTGVYSFGRKAGFNLCYRLSNLTGFQMSFLKNLSLASSHILAYQTAYTELIESVE